MVLLARLSHFFIPQETNNHKAKLLHHSSLSLIIGLFLIFQLSISSILIFKPSVLGFASQISPERIIELTNQERAKNSLPPLVLNRTLSESAQRKAGDMFAFNYWAHNSPSGRTPWTFFKEVGYSFLYAGENLARDFPSAEEAVNAWMASPTHRDNILNPKYKEIGISVVDGTLNGSQTTLIVQHFGTTAQQQAVESQKTTKAEASPIQEENAPPKIVKEAIAEEPKTENIINQAGYPVLAQATIPNKNLISPFSVTKTFSLWLLAAIGIVLVIDGFIIFKRKTFRLSGRSLAHTLFLISIILIIILSTQGLVI